MPCDICSAPRAPSIVSSSAMCEIVKRGFNPFTEGLIPDSLAWLATPETPYDWEKQVFNGVLSNTDWKVCDTCLAGIEKAGARSALTK